MPASRKQVTAVELAASRGRLMALASILLLGQVACSAEGSPVEAASIATITLSSASVIVNSPDVAEVEVTARDARGRIVPVEQDVTFSVSPAGLVSVSSAGGYALLNGLSEGEATLTARYAGLSATATITVLAEVSAIEAPTSYFLVGAGGSLQLPVVIRDLSGAPTTRPVTWTSSNPSVVSVSSTGRITAGTSEGRATVTVFAGGNRYRAFQVTRAPSSGGLTQLALGASSACALHNNGQRFCWGRNVGDTPAAFVWSSNATVPVGVTGPAMTSIVSGGSAFCGLAAGGAAYCWGTGFRGSLGGGTLASESVSADAPRLVGGGLSLVSLSGGTGHYCGLTAAGVAYCWGDNSSGQLGDGTRTTNIASNDRATPTAVATSERFSEIVAGRDHTCGLSTSGKVLCWGGPNAGTLGNGTYTTHYQLVPTEVSGGRTFSRVAASEYGTCAIQSSDGQPYCWGGDFALVPTAVPGSPALQSITFGGSYIGGTAFACGVAATTQRAWCWGGNGYGQLGDGSDLSRTSALPVSGSGQFVQLKAAPGGYYACGVLTTGQVQCWGDNRDSQLGDGTSVTRATPTGVVWP